MLTQPKMATNQRKRTVLSVDQKFEICKRLKKGATITSLSKELNIGKLMICDIKRNEEKLVTFVEKLFFTSITSFLHDMQYLYCRERFLCYSTTNYAFILFMI